ncbi:MAG TPA: hypothetical protein VGS10_13545 [Terracidiphilus sp.]|nr:hypothetical protein [Terracidiphilus sp.]
MNPIANIWKHPRTSVTGVLIAVATIAGVLSQQGVAIGHVGAGTAVTLAGSLATALLGLLARDPAQPASEPAARSTGTQARLGVWMLIALLLQITLISGCTESTVAKNIVNWTPAMQSAVATVNATAAQLDPKDAPIFVAATAGFNAASNLLAAEAKAYLANPSASVLAQMQAQVVVFQQQVNSALLQAARIVNSASQQRALASIQAVATAVTAILALIQSISSKQAIAEMAAASSIKLAALRPYMNSSTAADIVAGHYNEPVTLARMQVAQIEHTESAAGF